MKFEITNPTPLMYEIIEAHRAAPWMPVADAPEVVQYALTPIINWTTITEKSKEAPDEAAEYITVSVWTKPVMLARDGVGFQAIRYKSGDTEFYYVPEFGVFITAVQD